MNYKCPLDKCPVNFWPGRPMIQCLEAAHIPLLVDIVHTDITLYASNITQQYIFTNQFNDTSPLKHLSCFYFTHFNTGHCAMFILIFESIFLPGHANKKNMHLRISVGLWSQTEKIGNELWNPNQVWEVNDPMQYGDDRDFWAISHHPKHCQKHPNWVHLSNPPQKSPSILSRFYNVQQGLPHFTMTNTMSHKVVTSLALQFFLNMVKSNDILG